MKNRVMGFALLLGSTLFLAACPSETTIGQLNSEPRRYYDRDVSVRGVVTNSFGALGIGAYELDDETGALLVHDREHSACNIYRPEQVGLDLSSEVVLRHFFDRGAVGISGIVNHHVEFTEMIISLGNDLASLVGFGYIECQRENRVTEAFL